MLEFKLAIFYGSYLVFPFMIFLIYKIKNWKNFTKIGKVIFVIFSFLSIFFVDARFIEPNYIQVQKTEINLGTNEDIKIALIGDIHLGIYKKGDFLEKVIKKINKIEDLDYVFIAGDLTYFEKDQTNFELEKMFSSFKDIKKPVYWVLGNHDVEQPGPKIREELIKYFDEIGLNFLNNESVKLKGGITLVGLGDMWSGEDEISLLDKYKEEDNILVLTHNPDTTSKYTNKNVDLTLCGHTHGGQIKLPFIYKKVIPTNGNFDEGLTNEENTKLFVTSGIGVIGLPFRFLNPPVIDILTIKGNGKSVNKSLGKEVKYDNKIGNKNKNNKVVLSSGKIKITIGGDVMLSRVVGHLNKKDYGRITKKYNPITQTGGIVFLNLESPFSKNPKDGFHSSYLFGANVKNIQTLKDLKGDNEMIVSLANNHIKNSGVEGITTSIELLNKSKIYYSGVLLKKEKNKYFKIIKKYNNKICFESFTYDGSIFGKYKINKISKENIKKSLDEMKKNNCDLNLISLHWGREYKSEPTKTQVELAHYIIDNGADIIVGNHSHIFGKTEIYKEKPIFYSLGNFIFDQDAMINNCSYKDCIYDEKLKKKILPVQIGISYELIFQNKKLIEKKQKKHRMVNYGELRKY